MKIIKVNEMQNTCPLQSNWNIETALPVEMRKFRNHRKSNFVQVVWQILNINIFASIKHVNLQKITTFFNFQKVITKTLVIIQYFFCEKMQMFSELRRSK